ncbi:MAG TPA: AarF/UbiB family protein [Thiobacillaceae bacterium]|nr:AarF/UbiB family protein [Thiobacillaceae bacterium]HNU63548.1 AarF/UbiB family protein [Thiobacillaceae bacterium]
MLRETISVMRDFPRLHEIAAVLIRYGWGDAVRALGVANLLQRAGRILHWQTTSEIGQLDLPVRIRLALTELGPTFVKLGQVLATRVDVFPAPWIEEFERLHNQVPPVPFEAIRPELEKTWGRPVEGLFASFDPEPFAAASIAQVYRARLHDGAAVVVKARRPGILPKVEADLRILAHLARLLEMEMPDARRYHPLQIVSQLKRSLLRELDLVKEARNLEAFGRSFSCDDSLCAGVHIPRVYWDFCGENVNVQEELVGVPGTDLVRARLEGLDLKLLAARGADAVLKMILVDGYFHADPHPGNVIFLPGDRVGLLDFGMVGRVTDTRRDQLIDFLDALIHKSEKGMLNVLTQWAGHAEVDEEHLAYDLSEMVFGYDDLSLKDIRIGFLLSEITALMRDNHLSLPPDLALLFKAMITLEGLGHQLDPDFHLVDHLTPFVHRIMEDRYSPEALLRRGRRGLREMAEVVFGLPRDVARLFRQVRRGNFRVDLDLKRLDHFGVQLNRAANRLTMGILTASLVVGSSIIMTVEGGPELFGLPLFGLLGFLVAFFNSLWILVAIWHSGKE